MNVTLTVGPVTNGRAQFSVAADLPKGYKVAYAVLYDKAPGFVFDVGIGVASFVSGSPAKGICYFPFGPGTYDVYARVNLFDASWQYSATDSAITEIVV